MLEQRWPTRSALLPVGKMVAAHDFQRIKQNFKTSHNAATELRKIHGLDGTRTVLGHSSTDMTEIYAEIDFDVARKITLASG